MSDPKEIKKQTEIKSANVTPEEAAARIGDVREDPANPSSTMPNVELKKWSQLVAQAWSDEKFKQRLLENPSSVLREYGIEMPPGVEVRVVESTDKVRYITLPPKPAAAVTELDPGELAAVAGGFCCCVVACRTGYADTWVPKYADTWIYTA